MCFIAGMAIPVLLYLGDLYLQGEAGLHPIIAGMFIAFCMMIPVILACYELQNENS
jgi:hypothetical protein